MSLPLPPTVLLTGAAGGIGRGTALALAAKGCRLGLIDRDGGTARSGRGRGARRWVRPSPRGRPMLTEPRAMAAAVVELEAKLGPIDVLVACAGIGGLTPMPPDLDIDGLRAMLEVNVVGVARSIEAVLPGMIARGSGHIVGVSSVAGFRGSAVDGLLLGLEGGALGLPGRLEAGPEASRGVTITTACPGFVRTALTRDTPFRKPVPMLEPEQAGRYLARAALRRPRNCVFPMSTARSGWRFSGWCPTACSTG